jgi:endonuclease/exonuclease/phosphatase family metal-dependent hydrolase
LPAVNANVCRCAGTPGGDDPDNGVDDDCDGNPDRQTARIAFWNVRSLSSQSRDANELASIATVIGRFDAMAIAEVGDAEVIGQLERALDMETSWSSVTSEPVGNSPQSSERYAVLYRDDVFTLRSSRHLPELQTRRGAAFEREPFLAVLAAHAGADFALTVVHVVWGASEGPRIDEVRTLAEYYEMAWNNDRDVLILGDLNRNSGDPESIGWLEAEVGLLDTTDAFPPTKVDSSNTYDHVLLNPVETWEYGGVHGVELFDEEFFPGDADAASQAMSDHRPVWIEVAVGFDDD